MKRLAIIVLFSASFYLFLSHLACDKHPVSIPFPPPTPTATSTPIYTYIQMTGSLFSPAAVTIAATGGVIFTNMDGWGHTVQPDDGTGLCLTNKFVNPGESVTYVYLSPVTINYHCWIHSQCVFSPAPGFFGCDASCGGPGYMAGTIVVQ